ncbi:MAG: hypothetical protein R3211_10925 [Balneolaceae bacterium]|nr:hypothetical protein [Balneolaceae bacterium]
MAEEKKSKTGDKSDNSDGKGRIDLSQFEELVDRLKEERQVLEDEIKKDYRNARRYVRAHPEEGVLMSFIGGVVIGVLIGKLTK